MWTHNWYEYMWYLYGNLTEIWEEFDLTRHGGDDYYYAPDIVVFDNSLTWMEYVCGHDDEYNYDEYDYDEYEYGKDEQLRNHDTCERIGFKI